MAMNYTDLIGPKSRAGSIQSFVRYKPVPGEVILEDAQGLIYQALRVREMRVSTMLTLLSGTSSIALPARFLEAISMHDREGWNVIPERHISERRLQSMRTFDTSQTPPALDTGVPTHTAIFDEAFQFDLKADDPRYLDLIFFKTPAPLSTTNTTNFLTVRYPHLVRVACEAAAARFMKDTEEFTARQTELFQYCEAANAESDLGRPA